VELAPIHVTGSRLPRTSVQTTLPVTIIDRDDILRSGYGSLFDLLRHLPGMNGLPAMSSARSGDSQYLPGGCGHHQPGRHGTARHLFWSMAGAATLSHGVPGTGWAHRLGRIHLSFVERIELVRGGASAIYGADADVRRGQHHPRDQADGPEGNAADRSDSAATLASTAQAATGGLRGSGDRWFAGIDLHRVDHLRGTSVTGTC
jgi:hypothetical protein